jgi:hypothetical protein
MNDKVGEALVWIDYGEMALESIEYGDDLWTVVVSGHRQTHSLLYRGLVLAGRQCLERRIAALAGHEATAARAGDSAGEAHYAGTRQRLTRVRKMMEVLLCQSY